MLQEQKDSYMRSHTHSGAAVKPRRMHVMQALAWGYAAMFLSVVLVGYLPGLKNSQGQLLGLFRIELIDDALHLGSAIWAALAAWISARASTFYFKAFGSMYLLAGSSGPCLGRGFWAA